MTIAVTDDPPQFVKVTFGHERIAKSDSEAEVLKAERIINETCNKVVERRVGEFAQLVRRQMAGGEEPPARRSGGQKRRRRPSDYQ